MPTNEERAGQGRAILAEADKIINGYKCAIHSYEQTLETMTDVLTQLCHAYGVGLFDQAVYMARKHYEFETDPSIPLEEREQ